MFYVCSRLETVDLNIAVVPCFFTVVSQCFIDQSCNVLPIQRTWVYIRFTRCDTQLFQLSTCRRSLRGRVSYQSRHLLLIRRLYSRSCKLDVVTLSLLSHYGLLRFRGKRSGLQTRDTQLIPLRVVVLLVMELPWLSVIVFVMVVTGVAALASRGVLSSSSSFIRSVPTTSAVRSA